MTSGREIFPWKNTANSKHKKVSTWNLREQEKRRNNIGTNVMISNAPSLGGVFWVGTAMGNGMAMAMAMAMAEGWKIVGNLAGRSFSEY